MGRLRQLIEQWLEEGGNNSICVINHFLVLYVFVQIIGVE